MACRIGSSGLGKYTEIWGGKPEESKIWGDEGSQKGIMPKSLPSKVTIFPGDLTCRSAVKPGNRQTLPGG